MARTRSRLAALGVAALLSVGIQYVTLFPGLPTTSDVTTWGCTKLVIASSQEKFEMLRQMARTFNGQANRIDGRCVTIEVEQVFSGTAEAALATGWSGPSPCTPPSPCEKPDVWSPASYAWLNLFQDTRNPRAPKTQLVGDLFQSPLVIGMPIDMAKSLGYPATTITWSRVLELSQQGWGSVTDPVTGLPWGAFKLGKTTPIVSTSGLLALAATYFSANRGTDPTPADVNTLELRNYVKGIESSVIHYGDTAGDFLHALEFANKETRTQAYDFVSAILLQEKELFDYNRGVISGQDTGYVPTVPLVPVYPPQLFVADHPYIALDWNDFDPLGIKRSAADLFFRYVSGSNDQIEQSGFRVVDPAFAAGRPSDELQTAFCELLPVPAQCIAIKSAMIHPRQNLPDRLALKAELGDWDEVRKSLRVLVLVDDGGPPERAKPLPLTLPAGLGRTDEIGYMNFKAATPIVPVTDATELQKGYMNAQLALVAWQGTKGQGLVSAVESAVGTMQSSYNPEKINAVLLVESAPDGVISSSAVLEIRTFLENQPKATFVRVFTVGQDPVKSPGLLGDVAAAGRGAYYPMGSIDFFIRDSAANVQPYIP